VSTVDHIDEPVDLLVYHACVCVLAPFGGWRRTSLGINEVWLAGVRDGGRIVHGMKRRGILTVADLFQLKGRDREDFDGLFTEGGVNGMEERVGKKVADLLELLEDLLYDALGEGNVNEGGGGAGSRGGGGGGGGGGARGAAWTSSRARSGTARSGTARRAAEHRAKSSRAPREEQQSTARSGTAGSGTAQSGTAQGGTAQSAAVSSRDRV
jgi:hypothetical protein